MSPVIKKSSKEKKESAVSPVVGVMLMLVVTIIIAAVVAAFSTGLVGTAEKAPNAVLDVKIYEQFSNVVMGYVDTYPSLQIKSLGGDALNTKNMVLKFDWLNTTSNKKESVSYSGDGTYLVHDMSGNAYQCPAMGLLTLNGIIYEEPSSWYGNVTISNGDILQSTGLQSLFTKYPATQISLDEDNAFEIIFGSSRNSLKKGTPVHVVIMYKDFAIYDEEVVVL